MRTWIIKQNHVVNDTWPADMICIELDDFSLLYIQKDGRFDVSDKGSGMPTNTWWDCYGDI